MNNAKTLLGLGLFVVLFGFCTTSLIQTLGLYGTFTTVETVEVHNLERIWFNFYVSDDAPYILPLFGSESSCLLEGGLAYHWNTTLTLTYHHFYCNLVETESNLLTSNSLFPMAISIYNYSSIDKPYTMKGLYLFGQQTYTVMVNLDDYGHSQVLNLQTQSLNLDGGAKTTLILNLGYKRNFNLPLSKNGMEWIPTLVLSVVSIVGLFLMTLGGVLHFMNLRRRRYRLFDTDREEQIL